jgi:hypothetical protein
MPVTITQEKVNYYKQAKPVDDPDLVSIIQHLLPEAKHAIYAENHYVKEAIGKVSSVQRFLLNRYFNEELAKAPVSSINVRYNLINDGEIPAWKKLIETFVLPFMAEHDLPQ